MSLFDVAERLASSDRSPVQMDPERCLHSRDRFSTCELCFDLCPEGAIHPGRPPGLSTAECKSCLACLPTCPVGAFQAEDQLSSLVDCVTNLESKSVELLCELHPDPATGADPEGVGLHLQGCLAGLGSGAYLTLFSLGLEQIFLRTDACSQCIWQSLSIAIYQQARQTNIFLDAWGSQAQLICLDQVERPVHRTVWLAKKPPLSRRDFFRLLGRMGKKALTSTLDQDGAQQDQLISHNRLRVLAVASQLPQLQALTDQSLHDFGFATLTVSEACTACAACARACPTKALDFIESEERTAFALVFKAQYCIGCEACAHVCATAAITLQHSPTIPEIFGEETVVLQAGELIKCERCGVRIARRDDVQLCTVCEFRRVNPFSSKLPPGLENHTFADYQR